MILSVDRQVVNSVLVYVLMGVLVLEERQLRQHSDYMYFSIFTTMSMNQLLGYASICVECACMLTLNLNLY